MQINLLQFSSCGFQSSLPAQCLVQVGSSEDFWKEISFRNKVVTPSQVKLRQQRLWHQQGASMASMSVLVLLQATALLSRHTCVQVLDMSGLTCGLSNARLMRRLALGLRQLHALQFCHVGASDQTLSSGVLEVISDSLPSLKTLVLEGVTMQIELANAGGRRRLQQHVCPVHLLLGRAGPPDGWQQPWPKHAVAT